MDYKQVKSLKLYEQIANSIENSINTKQILPGEKLESVETLAKNFNVGRSAIREALTALQAKGFLEIRQGEGTFVRKLTVQDIVLHVPNTEYSTVELQQIFEVRKMLEIGLIEHAVLHRTDTHLQFLREAMLEMQQNMDNSQISSDADLRFHTTLAEATKNHLLFSMLKNISKPIAIQMQHTRHLISTNSGYTLDTLNAEHQQIYEAIEQKNIDLAKEAMVKHLNTIEQILFK